MGKSTLKFRFVLMVCFLILTSGISMAQVPQYISYQGKIIEDGIALTDSRTITFSLWAVDSGGDPLAALWYETKAVEIEKGIYNVQLGDDTPLPTDLYTNDALYLQVDIEHPTQGIQRLDPLMPFTSTMYALKAANADSLDGLTSLDFVGTGGATMTGPLNLATDGLSAGTNQLVLNSGNVGIGTAVPAHTLDIEGDINTSGVLMIDNTPVFILDDVSANAFIGPYAGDSITTGTENLFIGIESGASNTEGTVNTFVGIRAGRDNTIGLANTFIGAQAGVVNNEGERNSFIGAGAGMSNTTGNYNTYVGNAAGNLLENGSSNVMIGRFAGGDKTSGSQNVFLGNYSGAYEHSGSQNVFLGYFSGAFASGSNKLYIENSSSSSPLIYGEFDNDLIRINGNFEVTGGIGIGVSPSASGLTVDGDITLYPGHSLRMDSHPFIKIDNGNYNIGHYAGGYGTISPTGTHNIALGESAGFLNMAGTNNIFLGYQAGYNSSTGDDNIFIGNSSGYYNITGDENTFIGSLAGAYNETGDNNTFIGKGAGENNTTGHENTFIGMHAGNSNTTGIHNTIIGRSAGYHNETGSDNVFIGYLAGRNESGSDKLYIENTLRSDPLIYGEFDNRLIRINGDFEVTGSLTRQTDIHSDTNITTGSNFNDRVAPLTIGNASNTQLLIDGNQIEQANSGTSLFLNYTSPSDVVLANGGGNVGVGQNADPSYRLDVNGNIRCSNLTQTSDERLKTNVHGISHALDKIKDIRGVTFDWNEKSGFNTLHEKQIGVVAQELETVLPELVSTDKDGYKSVEYAKLSAVLIEAVKEQQGEIDTLKSQIHQLQIMVKNTMVKNLDQNKEKVLLSME